jgi:acetylxylan esterase
VRLPFLVNVQAYTDIFAVAAALVFGSTRRSANQTFTHAGGNISNGSAPRTAEQNAGLQPYADAGRLREYCQPGDPICAPQTENKEMAKHLNYFDLFGDEAAAWVVDLAKKAESRDRMSGAKSMLHQSISHPIANVFVLVFVLFAI